MQYSKVVIEVAGDQQDILIAQLVDLVESFEQLPDQLIAYFLTDLQFPVETFLLTANHPFEILPVEDKNWNEEWEQNFHSINIGSFCQIRASWHPVDHAIKHHFLLSPKMAFGTGHHPTTYLMMERMETVTPTDKKVLDVGCGTGILGVMAKMLGASYVEMVDIEEAAVENSIEHAELNNVSLDKVVLGTLDDIEPQAFDIIYANIQKHVILPILEPLHKYVHTNSIVQLSGILITDKQIVIDALHNTKWNVLFTKDRGEWCLIEITPNSD